MSTADHTVHLNHVYQRNGEEKLRVPNLNCGCVKRRAISSESLYFKVNVLVFRGLVVVMLGFMRPMSVKLNILMCEDRRAIRKTEDL